MPDIIITLTVKELKNGKRPIIVSAAPAGELPLILAGHFPDRIALIDAAWMQVLTRKPKAVKVAAEKVAAEKVATSKKVAAQAAASDKAEESEDAETIDAPTPEPDQLVRPEGLPVIEGDTPPAANSRQSVEDAAMARLPAAGSKEEQLTLF